jgi:hypothetical protein
MIPSELKVRKRGVSSPESLTEKNIRMRWDLGQDSLQESVHAVDLKRHLTSNVCYGVFVKTNARTNPLYHYLWANSIPILQSRIMKAALRGDVPQATRVRPVVHKHFTNTLLDNGK